MASAVHFFQRDKGRQGAEVGSSVGVLLRALHVTSAVAHVLCVWATETSKIDTKYPVYSIHPRASSTAGRAFTGVS